MAALKSLFTLLGMLLFMMVVSATWLGVSAAIFWWTRHDPDREQFKYATEILNSLCSALAFGGLLYTIWLQRKELAIQREEAKESRQELSEQTKVFAEQLQLMRASHEYIQQKERAFSEPILDHCGERSEEHQQKVIGFVNIGATVRDTEWISKTVGVIVQPHSDTILRSNGHGKIVLRGDVDQLPTIELCLRYKDGFGAVAEKHYVVHEGSFKLIESRPQTIIAPPASSSRRNANAPNE